ncbi:molybdopterin-dependent oxidoreductase [Sulfitobacter sp. S190]|uniref:molybdopterin-dependent oxidoreductase n=1 Tax=Sulfitobacter sp. S190 TaxID=2867022 RepID=UPI0021A3F712|nr:molybdopterin-dependent oxidoreductase [Sulfitobacter sp. S190]UWR22004.1 molybdopterin-dependent oxidoreductase [Sulfitobacter sp. S190]
MFQTIVRFASVAALAIGLSHSALADNQPTPLLSISGDITTSSGESTLALDMGMLRALPETTFETSTIWTDGVHTFTGVSLADLMAELGVEDGTLVATAINDYAVEIPVSDAVEGGPIIAYLMDGEEMTVRDKGPLWVIYPYDSNADYRSEVVYSRSIWQLDRLEIVQ